MDNAMLAMISYDANGKIVRVSRNGYISNEGVTANRNQEYSLLKSKYDYFATEAQELPVAISQIKKEPVFYAKEDMLAAFPNMNTISLTFAGITYTVNPYYRIFLPNYDMRCKDVFETFDYSLYTGRKIRVRETQEYQFGDYDIATGHAAANFPGLPDEKAYVYERLLAATGIPFTRTTTQYTYNSNAHLQPSVIKTTDSRGISCYPEQSIPEITNWLPLLPLQKWYRLILKMQ